MGRKGGEKGRETRALRFHGVLVTKGKGGPLTVKKDSHSMHSASSKRDAVYLVAGRLRSEHESRPRGKKGRISNILPGPLGEEKGGDSSSLGMKKRLADRCKKGSRNTSSAAGNHARKGRTGGSIGRGLGRAVGKKGFSERRFALAREPEGKKRSGSTCERELVGKKGGVGGEGRGQDRCEESAPP